MVVQILCKQSTSWRVPSPPTAITASAPSFIAYRSTPALVLRVHSHQLEPSIWQGNTHTPPLWHLWHGTGPKWCTRKSDEQTPPNGNILWDESETVRDQARVSDGNYKSQSGRSYQSAIWKLRTTTAYVALIGEAGAEERQQLLPLLSRAAIGACAAE